MLEFSGGLRYKLKENLDIYIASGLLFTQQALIIPIRLGIRIK
jgi:hypothetical protein